MIYTAKSFRKYPIEGEPFEQNKKMYVNIRYADGYLRPVRAYTEQEYIKMYPEEEIKPTKLRSTKEVLGFTKGFITIFPEVSDDDEEWLRLSSARYHKIFGWYFISDDELPQLPCGLSPRELRWETIADVDKDELRSEAEVRKAVAEALYEESSSQFQGTIGDRIDRILTVTKSISIDNGKYGPSTFYLFSDERGNVYSWTTAAKQLEVGETYFIRGTVKEHRTYKRESQTVLTRCQVQ